jgi:predicted acetyltransferase
MITPSSDSQRRQCLDLWRDAFHVDDRWCDEFTERVGWEIVRCAELNDRVATAAVVHPFAQYFGGRRLGSAGLALVACAAEFRSRGLTRGLLVEALREQYGAGVSLSALYPSTRTLYRKLGYETAGAIFRYTVPLDRIRLRAEKGEMKLIGEGDLGTVKNLYRAWALSQPGPLDRNEFLWRRIVHARDGSKRRAYLAFVDGEPRGYVFYHRGEGKDGRRTVEAWDVVALDADVGRLILSFMADLRTTNDDLIFWGGANDPLLMLLDEQRFDVTLNAYWMLRILNVERALCERGYNPAVNAAESHFNLTGEEVIDANNGRFTLRVSSGRGEVGGGGRGDLEISIRGLAPLFSGHLAPIQLARCGLLKCADEGVMAAAAAVFASPQPRMGDAF